MPRLGKSFPILFPVNPMTNQIIETPSKPSSQNRAFEKRLRRHVVGREREYFAITMPGFEELCTRELTAIGLDEKRLRTETGGVAFAGRFVDCQRVNLMLRTATRILMRLDSFVATNPRQLSKNADRIAWELFFKQPPSIKVSSHHSRLYHTQAVSRIFEENIARRLLEEGGHRPVSRPQTLYVRITDDRFVLSMDSSGEPLYKRGFKSGPARAPIRETLAAIILDLAGYDPTRPLVDPMCGSGSFSLEAALMAKHMAPGLKREFAFMDWPAFTEKPWAFMTREAESQITGLDGPRIFASDIDSKTVEGVAQSVGHGGLTDAVAVSRQDFFNIRGNQFSDGPGLLTLNPPYGVRIGSARQAQDLFMAIRRHLQAHFKGWTVALIAPSQALLSQMDFAEKRIPLVHGGLTLSLVIGTIRS